MMVLSSVTIDSQGDFSKEECVFGKLTKQNITNSSEPIQSFQPAHYSSIYYFKVFSIVIICLFSLGLLKECYNTITCNGKSKRCVRLLSKTCIGNLSNREIH